MLFLIKWFESIVNILHNNFLIKLHVLHCIVCFTFSVSLKQKVNLENVHEFFTAIRQRIEVPAEECNTSVHHNLNAFMLPQDYTISDVRSFLYIAIYCTCSYEQFNFIIEF